MMISALKRLVWIVCAATGIVAIAAAVDVFRDPSTSIPEHRRVRRKLPSLSGPGKFDLHSLSSYSHIWKTRGLSSAVSRVPSPATGPSEISSLFRLRSVFLVKSKDTVQGFAAIARGDEEDLYSEGAMLVGNYRLVLVEADHAVLEKNGKRYVLPLEKTPYVEVRPDGGSKRPRVSQKPPVHPDQPSDYTNVAGMIKDKVVLPSKDWDYAVNNLDRIMHEVRIQTDLSGPKGSMRGLRIDPRRGSLPYKYGFRIGDVIRAVDGKPLRSLKDVMSIYQEYLKLRPERVQIVFERGGKLRMREVIVKK